MQQTFRGVASTVGHFQINSPEDAALDLLYDKIFAGNRVGKRVIGQAAQYALDVTPIYPNLFEVYFRGR